ncbi:uncharacterized protein Dana_GF26677 [Drosophila ananassae]|uniref:C-type lectin domain-containing protein n=1 Tax=Drosophila ananassae TaxID=7217 RepID=A0A0P8ZFL0_DROAN|nr:uncharacterized protein LOC26514086 [Drosophila ananassae]KPU73553.1 uncharacterized protein Dana_GF26677 [Drosophila ananassae]
MKFEILIILIVIIVVSSSTSLGTYLRTPRAPQPQQRICGGNFTAIGSKCYYIEKDNAQEWLSAIYQCSRMGGHLASIESVQELDAISKELKSNSEYFVEKTYIPGRHGLGENRQIEPGLQKNITGTWNYSYECTVINSSGRTGTAMGYLNRLFVCEKNEEPTQEQKQNIIKYYKKIGEKYYYIENSDPAQWNIAFHVCKDWGGHLATPRNELELINLSKILEPGIQYLIDLNDYLEEGQFMSVTTGLKNNYVSWAAGEPNMEFGVGNVVIEKTELGTYMRHVPHQYPYSYICEASI